MSPQELSSIGCMKTACLCSQMQATVACLSSSADFPLHPLHPLLLLRLLLFLRDSAKSAVFHRWVLFLGTFCFSKPLSSRPHRLVWVSQNGRGPSRIERDRMKLALLEEAHIVCSTLSFSGSPLFTQMSRKFDVVVIDEAAQAVEPAILVPLVQGVKQVGHSHWEVFNQGKRIYLQ